MKGDWSLLIFPVIIFLFYFLLIRPNSKRRQKMMQAQRNVGPGARVITTAGMHATVAAASEAHEPVLLEVAPGVVCRYERAAIMRVLDDDTPVIEEPAAGDATTGDAGADDDIRRREGDAFA